MDVETFQKLSAQLISGKMSHIEFLRILKQCGEAYEPPDTEGALEKEEMMSLLEGMIENAENRDHEEKQGLAQAVESWLGKPNI